MNSNKQNLINKIIYRSQYRGTKEMDIFVSSFVKSIIDSLSIDDLKDLDLLVMLSTAQPSLREQGFIIINIYFNNKIT